MKDLKKLVSMPTVSGNENLFSDEIKSLFSDICDEFKSDVSGNIYGIKRNGNGKRKIIIDAHFDIIGLIVTKISDDGLIRFSSVGGVDIRILPSMKVVIHGKKDIRGVIGVPPPHLQKDDADEPYKIEALTIDTGLSKEELLKNIETGTLISFDSSYTKLLNNRISASGLDNKLGVYCALKSAAGITADNTEIIVALTTGEEINLNGARIASNISECDFCIVIDVTHGSTPDSERDISFELGSGPAIAVGPGLSKKHTDMLINCASKNDIPFSIEVTNGHTGTNSLAYEVSGEGIPCMVVSLPLRYMHTAYETADLSDVENVIKLITDFINRYGEWENA